MSQCPPPEPDPAFQKKQLDMMSTRDPAGAWNAELQQRCEAGMTPQEAIKSMDGDFPGLRERMLKQTNAGRQDPRKPPSYEPKVHPSQAKR